MLRILNWIGHHSSTDQAEPSPTILRHDSALVQQTPQDASDEPLWLLLRREKQLRAELESAQDKARAEEYTRKAVARLADNLLHQNDMLQGALAEANGRIGEFTKKIGAYKAAAVASATSGSDLPGGTPARTWTPVYGVGQNPLCTCVNCAPTEGRVL